MRFATNLTRGPSVAFTNGRSGGTNDFWGGLSGLDVIASIEARQKLVHASDGVPVIAATGFVPSRSKDLEVAIRSSTR